MAKYFIGWTRGLSLPILTNPGRQASSLSQTISSVTVTNTGGAATYSMSGEPTGLAIDSSTGVISGTIDAGATVQEYDVVVTATNATGESSVIIPWRVHSAATTISSGDTFPYYCNTANRLYRLTENITTNGSAIAIIASGVSLDLNGFTITYDNDAPVSIANPSFEDVTGSDADHWDRSGAADSSLYNNASPNLYVQGEGEYAMSFAVPCTEQYVVNDTEAVCPANRWYAAMCSCVDTIQVTGSSCRMHFLLTGTDNANVYGATGFTTGGGQRAHFETLFQTGGSSESYELSVGVSSSAAVPTANARIDDLAIRSTRVHGVAVRVVSGQTPTNGIKNYTDLTTYGNGTDAWVINGTITQGQGDGYWCHGVFGNSTNGMVCSGLTVNVSGMSCHCIYGENCGTDASPTEIEDCTLNNTSTQVFQRSSSSTLGATIALAQPNTGGINAAIITRNVINGSPQTGIYWDGFAAEVTHNSVSVRSTYTNGFGIMMFNDKGSTIANNEIDNHSSTYSGRGIMIGGGFSVQTTPVAVYNNTIVARELAQNKEYAGTVVNGCYGIQVEGKANVSIYNNDVTVYADEAEAYCMRHNGGSLAGDNEIYNNTFRAVQVDSSKTAAAVSMISQNATYAVDFRDNTLITNHAVFGDMETCPTGSVRIVRPTIQASGTVTSWVNMITKNLGSVDNILIVDPTFADSTTETNWDGSDVRYFNGSADSGSSYVQQWTYTINVSDGVSPVDAADITVDDQFATEVATGTTNVLGVATIELPERRVDGATVTTHNPLDVSTVKTGYTTDVTAVSPTAPGTLNITLSEA